MEMINLFFGLLSLHIAIAVHFITIIIIISLGHPQWPTYARDNISMRLSRILPKLIYSNDPWGMRQGRTWMMSLL